MCSRRKAAAPFLYGIRELISASRLASEARQVRCSALCGLQRHKSLKVSRYSACSSFVLRDASSNRVISFIVSSV